MHREMANIAACYSSAGVAINAAGAATIKTTNASQIMFNGAIKSVAATSAIAFPATIASQPAGTTFTYLLTFKFSDSSARIFGPQELLDVNGTNIGNRNPTANATAIANSLPRVPNGFVVVGAVKILPMRRPSLPRVLRRLTPPVSQQRTLTCQDTRTTVSRSDKKGLRPLTSLWGYRG